MCAWGLWGGLGLKGDDSRTFAGRVRISRTMSCRRKVILLMNDASTGKFSTLNLMPDALRPQTGFNLRSRL
jgi:hypothetical protein